MSVASAIFPSTADDTPAIPNANPKKIPDTSPTFIGKSSCAYTRIAENADDIISPIITLSATVHSKFAYGIASANGAEPKIDHQITSLRPYLSPTGPPTSVPNAVESRNTKSMTCDVSMLTPNFDIR